MIASVKHKPANDYEKQMFKHIARLERFTLGDLESQCATPRWRAAKYVRQLREEGLVRICDYDRQTPVYTALDPKSAQAHTKKERGSKEGVLWTQMRALKVFSPDDLAVGQIGAGTQITQDFIKAYCGNLLKSGYLKVVEKARPGIRPARYHLVRNTGPLPPQVRKTEVIEDRNEQRVVFVKGGRL